MKIALFFVVFCSQIFALSGLDLARNIVGDAKSSQLNLLFAHQNHTDGNGNLDLDKISRILKTNSLLNLTLPSSRTLTLNFKAKGDAVLFFKIINEALSDAGYVYFTPTDLNLMQDSIDYTIQVESQYILDPGTFYRLLKSSSVYITNVKALSKYDYAYELDFGDARLKTNTNLPLNTPTKLEKPFKDYVLNLKGASTLLVEANAADNWFAKILFLDKNLGLIKAIKSTEKSNSLSQTIPSGAIYAIISDMYNLDNIRRGLTITLKK
ncbi:hypothetical protein [Campylobacter sp.]|uniref:hypothetical protein n=1 Tax=Campylobacter sp. TaxID=205 RepID=UPI0026DCE904|nr:hypothetical protein [Campylobacter sp.]MDO4673604.1 hypothetical protein [Campylobacter sp.]